ncbi:hypothetical protein [Shewanella sp. 6_MG-2023]|uniref:hypothetical protein n=1 Tax=Shewanella sp. 6_MG-2023 TaxID=3062660 RepID=UPI0026E46876|nr:hypothetical protein [Shewanella sp. 6_MG-2023]MDO6620272.1 hypothetical protein [Shewanella sp. 6_MG-2023]
MNKPPLRLTLLIALYVLLSIVALWRSYSIQSIDLFSIGVIPVLVGLLMRTHWASIALKVYLAIQTLAILALSTTAIIAYQITPEDVKVVFNGFNIPIPAIAAVLFSLLVFQYWVAFCKETTIYLKPKS